MTEEDQDMHMGDNEAKSRSGDHGHGPIRGAPPKLIDVDAVADWLGMTERHVRMLVREGRIPYLRWSRRLKFDPAEITAWLDSVRVPAGATVTGRSRPAPNKGARPEPQLPDVARVIRASSVQSITVGPSKDTAGTGVES